MEGLTFPIYLATTVYCSFFTGCETRKIVTLDEPSCVAAVEQYARDNSGFCTRIGSERLLLAHCGGSRIIPGIKRASCEPPPRNYRQPEALPHFRPQQDS